MVYLSRLFLHLNGVLGLLPMISIVLNTMGSFAQGRTQIFLRGWGARMAFWKFH